MYDIFWRTDLGKCDSLVDIISLENHLEILLRKMSSTDSDLDDFRQAFDLMGVKAAGDRLKIIIGIDYGTTFSGKTSSWICRIYLTCYRYQLCHFRQD